MVSKSIYLLWNIKSLLIEKDDPAGGYGKVVSSVTITLKTSKGTK